MVIAVATLIVVGPKDLPVLLRTIGKYVGILKRQASEFRGHFDDAIRDTEFDQLKKDVENIKSDFESGVRDTTEGIKSEFSDMQKTMDDTVSESTKPEVAEPLSVNDLNAASRDDSNPEQTAALEAEELLGADDNANADGDVADRASDTSEAASDRATDAPKKTAGA